MESFWAAERPLRQHPFQPFDNPPQLIYITYMEAQMTETILAQFPDTQAIYLFGSFGTEHEWPASDVDIALLLPRMWPKKSISWPCRICSRH